MYPYLKKPIRVSSLVFAILFFIAGCATVGRDFPVHPVAQLVIGTTSVGEVKELFGEPWRVGLEDGQKTWTYGHYKYSAFNDDQTKDLIIRFDNQGKVASYSFNSTKKTDVE